VNRRDKRDIRENQSPGENKYIRKENGDYMIIHESASVRGLARATGAEVKKRGMEETPQIYT